MNSSKEVSDAYLFFIGEEQTAGEGRPWRNPLGGRMKYQILLLVMLLVAACTPQAQTTPEPDTPLTSPPGDNMSTNEPVLNPFAPQPGDTTFTRGNIYLNEASLVIRESFPPQVSLNLAGDLPTPCNQLRVDIAPPDQQKQIMVDVYSVVDPNQVCAQVLEPFEESVDLGTFPTGHYTVWVNGQMAGEFDT